MKKLLTTISILIIAAVIGIGAICLEPAPAAQADGQKAGAFSLAAAPAQADGQSDSYIAEITFNNLNLPNGSIVRALQVFVDKQKLTAGASELQKELRLASAQVVLSSIYSEYTAKGYNITFDEEVIEITLEKYDSITDYYLAKDYNGYKKPQKDNQLKWGLLYNTYSHTDKTVFSNIDGTIIQAIAQDIGRIEGIHSGDIAYIYNYGTTYSRRTITSDADNIYYYSKLGINIHKFVMTDATLNREYTMQQSVPNVLAWYGGAILLVAIPAVALIIYAYKKKREAK